MSHIGMGLYAFDKLSDKVYLKNPSRNSKNIYQFEFYVK